MGLEYTCDNCRRRGSIHCNLLPWEVKCNEFDLDETTISKQECMIVRALRYIVEDIQKEVK